MIELIDKMESSYYLNIQSNQAISNVSKKFKSSANEDVISVLKANHNDTGLCEFYTETNGLELSWDYDLDQNLCGRMKISRLEYVLEDWSKKLYYEGADERLKYFRPLDIFTEEACIGVLLDGSGNPELYYHEFGDGNIFSLDLNFTAYFDLSIDAQVFLYWQSYLIELLHGNQGTEVRFKTSMKEMFPDFDLAVFTRRFEDLRLSKNNR